MQCGHYTLFILNISMRLTMIYLSVPDSELAITINYIKKHTMYMIV